MITILDIESRLREHGCKVFIRKDGSSNAERDYLRGVQSAIDTYNADFLYTDVAELAPTGTVDLTLPELWEREISEICNVEYPISTTLTPNYLHCSQYRLSQSSAGYTLRLYGIPTSPVALHYTRPHKQDEIPRVDLGAVADLATAHLCLWVADHYNQFNQPGYGAEVADVENQANLWRSSHDKFKSLYEEHMKTRKANDRTKVNIIPLVKQL